MIKVMVVDDNSYQLQQIVKIVNQINASNTPLACTIMGVELFGGENVLYFAIACFAAYYCSGHKGIYTSQRVAVRKYGNII